MNYNFFDIRPNAMLNCKTFKWSSLQYFTRSIGLCITVGVAYRGYLMQTIQTNLTEDNFSIISCVDIVQHAVWALPISESTNRYEHYFSTLNSSYNVTQRITSCLNLDAIRRRAPRMAQEWNELDFRVKRPLMYFESIRKLNKCEIGTVLLWKYGEFLNKCKRVIPLGGSFNNNNLPIRVKRCDPALENVRWRAENWKVCLSSWMRAGWDRYKCIAYRLGVTANHR